MNKQQHSLRHVEVRAWTALLLLAGVTAATAAPSQKSSAPEHKTRAVAVEDKPVPQSVFTVTTNSAEGRNPFFPKSTGTAAKRPPETIRPVTPVLNGLGGTPEQKLAIINNNTFAEGEEGDIASGSVKTKIRVVEIKTDSVVIEIGGERRELHLRSGN